MQNIIISEEKLNKIHQTLQQVNEIIKKVKDKNIEALSEHGLVSYKNIPPDFLILTFEEYELRLEFDSGHLNEWVLTHKDAFSIVCDDVGFDEITIMTDD